MNQPTRSTRFARGMFLWLLMVLAPASLLSASEDRRELLRRSTDSVWFQSEEDRIVGAQPLSRNRVNTEDRNDWLANASKSNWNLDRWEFFGQSLRSIFSTFMEFVYYAWGWIVISILGIAVVWLMYLLYRMQRPNQFSSADKRSPVSIAQQQKKVTDLPFKLQPSEQGLLYLAERFRAQGDYSRAIVYLYSHILIELDAAGLIRLERGKTNWSYVRELRSRDFERSYTSIVVQWFEHVFFGKNSIDAKTFESIWSGLKQFESNLGIAEVRR